MGKQPDISDDQLLNYLDGTLKPEEQTLLKQTLMSNQRANERLEELRLIHTYLKSVRVEETSKNFTEGVINRLNQPQLSGYLTRNGILLLAGALVTIGLASLLLSSGMFDSVTSINLNQLGITNTYFERNLPTIPFNGRLIVNMVILANIALAFIVLDRTVLKPWFERRRTMNLL
ncbi:MAG: hypothetical protein HRU69_08780 [Flammeovirgaceae bacterium]|nr:MAG: hypothetical protein HRU69_08780 [Flammeovirgaceae bacterium]